MKTTSYCSVALGLVLAITVHAADSRNKVTILKKFNTANATISKDAKVTDDQTWQVSCEKGQVIRLFEVPNPEVENCRVIYRAKIKSESLSEPAYLEMWCRFPGKGEYFSRGLDSALTGSNDWGTFETPFFLKKGERPDLIKLNVVLKGSGKIWLKDIELLKGEPPAKQ